MDPSMASQYSATPQSQVMPQSGMQREPEERIKYVQVPVEKEVIVKVPRQQIVEKIKHVPKVEYRYVDKIIEVPRINVVEKVVEVPEYVDRVKHVPVKKVVEVPRDVITYVPKVEVKVVEREVEVPGEIIQVPKKVEVINRKMVHKFVDTEVPTVVAQTFKPHVVESSEHVQTAKLKKYVPYMVPVEVYVPVAVERDLIPGQTEEEQRSVNLPAAQFNAHLKAMNPDLTDEDLANAYKRNADGSIPMYKGPGSNPVVLGDIEAARAASGKAPPVEMEPKLAPNQPTYGTGPTPGTLNTDRQQTDRSHAQSLQNQQQPPSRFAHRPPPSQHHQGPPQPQHPNEPRIASLATIARDAREAAEHQQQQQRH